MAPVASTSFLPAYRDIPACFEGNPFKTVPGISSSFGNADGLSHGWPWCAWNLPNSNINAAAQNPRSGMIQTLNQ